MWFPVSTAFEFQQVFFGLYCQIAQKLVPPSKLKGFVNSGSIDDISTATAKETYFYLNSTLIF